MGIKDQDLNFDAYVLYNLKLIMIHQYWIFNAHDWRQNFLSSITPKRKVMSYGESKKDKFVSYYIFGKSYTIDFFVYF